MKYLQQLFGNVKEVLKFKGLRHRRKTDVKDTNLISLRKIFEFLICYSQCLETGDMAGNKADKVPAFVEGNRQ